MSLKQRLVAWLVALTVSALLLVGWVGYTQASGALEQVAAVQLRELADDLADTVSHRHRQIQDALVRLSGAEELSLLLSDRAGVTQGEGALEERGFEADGQLPAAVRQDPIVEELVQEGASVQLVNEDGRVVASIGDVETDRNTGPGPSSCPTASDPGRIEIAADVPAPEPGEPPGRLRVRGNGRLLLVPSPRQSGVGSAGWSAVVDEERERVLWSSDCAALPVLRSGFGRDGAPPRGWSTGDPEWRYRGDRGDRLATRSGIDGTPFSVVATAGLAGYLAPLQDLGRTYGLFIVLVAIGVALAALLIVNRQLGSLEAVATASRRIGDEKEPVPWLPPPGNDEVGRLTLALNRMADRIDQRMQNVEHSGRMTAIQELASHFGEEMKNPLSSIRLSLQGMQREVERGELPERCERSIETSLSEIDRLDRMVSKVLKAGQWRKTVMDPCSVRDAIQDCAELLGDEFQRKGIRFRAYLHEGPDRVMADYGRLKNSLLQLFTNSVEALSDGGQLVVQTEATEWRDGRAIVVSVRDDGPGIEQEIRGQIFDPFFSTKSDAAGIGLAVARRNVQEFGGELQHAPQLEIERGCHFKMILPMIEDFEPRGAAHDRKEARR